MPDGLGAPPAERAIAAGPSIQDTGGSTGESSTYETRDTLKNKHDEDLFDYYAASQVALVDSTTLAVKPVGKPGNHEMVDPAPDNRHLLVVTIHKPYSYVTTHERFPREIEVWDLARRPAGVARIASIPLTDRVPVAGVPTGPREFAWRADEPATLVWAEALDRGDWKVQVPQRDKVLLQKAPFSAPPVEVARTEQRFTGFLWTERADIAVMEEFAENRHWRRAFVVDVDRPQSAPRVLWDLSSDEKYADPGRPVFRQQANGQFLVRLQGDAMYLSGTGASPAGDRPFLDKLDLQTRKSVRLFRSDPESFERFLAFTGDDDRRFLTWHQSAATPPNAWLRMLGDPADATAGEATIASTRVAVTRIADPTPAVRAIRKRLVTYKCADGVDLSFTLYTPPGYVEGTRVPTILYAYPLDFAEASKAGQVSGSPATFTRLRQYELLLLAGNAIIDRASFPVIGDPKKAYDTYLEPLVADAKAAVDEAVRVGVADPERIGVTGHSHGALMTVNLLANSGPVPRRRGDQRLVQQDADAVRFPERTSLRVGGPGGLHQGLAVLHGRQDQAAGPHHPRRRGRQSRHDAAAGRQALRGHPRQRRNRTPGDASQRAALVLGDGIAGAADLRDAALVRQVREGRAVEGARDLAASGLRRSANTKSGSTTTASERPVELRFQPTKGNGP